MVVVGDMQTSKSRFVYCLGSYISGGEVRDGTAAGIASVLMQQRWPEYPTILPYYAYPPPSESHW